MILCDTTFLVDILRKEKPALSLLATLKIHNLFTTEISIMEIYYGLYSNPFLQEHEQQLKARQDQIIGMINHFIVLPFDRNAATQTAQLMGRLSLNGQKIDFRDGMIIGTALSNGITKVISQNRTHFKRVEKIEVISY